MAWSQLSQFLYLLQGHGNRRVGACVRPEPKSLFFFVFHVLSWSLGLFVLRPFVSPHAQDVLRAQPLTISLPHFPSISDQPFLSFLCLLF